MNLSQDQQICYASSLPIKGLRIIPRQTQVLALLEDYRLTRILPRKTVGLSQAIERNDYHDGIRVGPFDVSWFYGRCEVADWLRNEDVRRIN